MPDPTGNPPTPIGNARAVFLSYTSEDKAVALALCEALREGGVDVWMDQSELQGGDAWDDHIRRQLRECALIVPIISARTQARREGYFRLEWKLADERMHLVAEGTPLIVPVVADDTQQKDALVPKSFLAVQWSRLPHGHVPPAFVTRVRRLLGLEPAGSAPTQAPIAMTPAAPTASEMELLEPLPAGRPRPPAPTRRTLPLMLCSCVALVGGAVAMWFLKPVPPAPPKLISRFVHEVPQARAFRSNRPVIAISPDGRSFVYNAEDGLLLRNMGDTTSHVIPGTEDSIGNPVFSPDGQWIAFLSRSTNRLFKIAIEGGVSVPIFEGSISTRGLSWETDGTILIGAEDGIWRVAAAGGKPEKIVPAVSGELFSSPQILPGGQAVLFARSKSATWQIEVATLPSGERKVVVPGGRAPRYVPETGHLLYVVESDLFGVGFDPDRRTTIGGPVSLVQDVGLVSEESTSGLVNYSVAGDGTLLYVAGSRGHSRGLVWVDREGREEPLKTPPDFQYVYPRISPDGRRVAIGAVGQSGNNIYVWDFSGETRTRLTLGEDGGREPIWTPDGTRIVYNSLDGKLSAKAANNVRFPEVFVDTSSAGRRDVSPYFFTPDGRGLVVGAPVGIVSLDAKAALRSLGAGSIAPVLSLDGKWIAYTSAGEVYVSPFPNVDDDRVQVSSAGGVKPLWSRDGRELFYLAGPSNSRRLMVASVQADGGKLAVQSRRPVWPERINELNYLYNQGPLRNYDISPIDGRFLMLKTLHPANADDTSEQIFIVQNWTEELKRRVPVKAK